MKEAKKQLIAGQEQAEEELGKLAEAVVACYENEPGNVGAEIKVRMTRKQKALVEQVSFPSSHVPQHKNGLISSVLRSNRLT